MDALAPIIYSTKAERLRVQPSLTSTHVVAMSEDANTKAVENSKVKRTEFTPELMEYLRQSLDYDPETGDLRWRERPCHHFRNSHSRNVWNSSHAGKIAGCRKLHHTGVADGSTVYFRIHGRRVPLQRHRIVYSLAVRPLESREEVDHKDRNPLNNRLENLRLVTRSQNLHNMVNKRRSGNKTGLPKGVSRNASRFFASIMVNGTRYHLGGFATPLEAHEAYKAKSIELMGEFSPYSQQ